MPRTSWRAAISTSARARIWATRSDEIADLVRDFDTMAGELRNQIQSERNLLSGVSHELRSPIARIRLALTLARDADEPNAPRCSTASSRTPSSWIPCWSAS